MMNGIPSMRNINLNLFDVPVSANALEEYDSDAAGLVREAARKLHAARTGDDQAALAQASQLTCEAAAHLLAGAGSSVYVRFPVMMAARLVELEAALLRATPPAVPAKG
ncbi:hypothetical protein ACFWXK_14400 [Streptomyces sp. NPDC059070]|uniref:hypothetical protein n=1 Tax=Streptomyces sp. NPDC059070 TaxID=3346713 RepID=UPI0036A75A65